MTVQSIGERAARTDVSTAKWIGWTIATLILWGVLYSQLEPFADWVVATLPVKADSQLGAAISFFAYDMPKVLLLLTLGGVRHGRRPQLLLTGKDARATGR